MDRLLRLIMAVCFTDILVAGPVRPPDPKFGATLAKGAPKAEGKPIPIWTGVAPGSEGSGLEARLVREGDGSVCILAVGKMLGPAEAAAARLVTEGA